MATTRSSFREIVGRYDAVFVDAFGVLKSSQGVIDGVLDTLCWLRDEAKPLWVVTNDASKSPELMATTYLDGTGAPLIAEDRFVSSGQLASKYLSKHVPYGRVAFLGKPRAAHYIEMAGLIPVPISECKSPDRLVAIVLLDDEGYDWFRDINTTLNLVRRANVPVIIANRDLVYPLNNQDIALAVGSLGNMMEPITEKTFIRFGKPGPEIFELALGRAQQALPGLDKKNIIFVGDTLRTDIEGARDFGLDTILVLSGNTLPDQADALIAKTGLKPTYVCESIAT